MAHMFVVGRGRHGRPTLQHILVDSYGRYTACGVDVIHWSRAYSDAPILPILCKTCNKKG